MHKQDTRLQEFVKSIDEQAGRMPSSPATPASLRRTVSGWRTTYTDEQGRERHLVDVQKVVNFSWISRHIGPSRMTLIKWREAGRLKCYEGRRSTTRTDLLFRAMIGGK